MPQLFDQWSEHQLKKIRFFVIEFIVKYRVRNGSRASPSTMKNYVVSVQRGMNEFWKYKLPILSGSVFTCPSKGLVGVLNTLFQE